jgi:hypothetical protein
VLAARLLTAPHPLAQVCDDSTREDVRRRIDTKVSEMSHRGHCCLVTRRDANKGFKVRSCDRTPLLPFAMNG